jgi:hypothetical protein
MEGVGIADGAFKNERTPQSKCRTATILNKRWRIHFIEFGLSPLVLNVNIHPGALNLVKFLTLKPEEKNRSSVLRCGSLFWIVEVLIHSSPEVVTKADIDDYLRESG